MYLSSHTYFSLRYGVFSPKALVEFARAHQLNHLVLTDINNTSCSFTFIKECRANGITPILGVEFRHQGNFLYLAIAKDEEGWREINAWLTKISIQNIKPPSAAPTFTHCYVIYRKCPKRWENLEEYEYVGVRPSEVNKLYSSPQKIFAHKMVVYAPITYDTKEQYRIHQFLRCIDKNILIGKLETHDMASPHDRYIDEKIIESAFAQFPMILENTKNILENCHIDLVSDTKNNRNCFTESKESDFALLKKLARSGCQRRYKNQEKAVNRVESELKVILELGFAAYFLITWDIVRYARSAGYFHVGRGSGANSIVAYCLYITDVDPLELDLYFERFINPHRSSPPDFDIDFSWDERDDVTDYIFKRYGSEYTALLATYNTFKGKSIIRELGKVFGLPKEDIDTIVDHPLDKTRHHPFAEYIFYYGKMMEGFPNYLSIHAGGVIVSERPLNYYTALQMMPKGFPIVHFDMYEAEDLQFHKYDVLSQRGLGHIKEAVDIIRNNKGLEVDVHQVERIKMDPKVRAQLRSGRCIGCFYIESPAMRGLLSKLKCDNYVHLVAASSIIRPGVAQSGMMREYIERFHHKSKIKYLHPVFEEHLGETYGIMVYQEDVMKIVHHFSGLGLDESDVLRRIMTGKKKSSDTFYRLMEKFFNNCAARGYPDELTKEVWRQIESFSGYSFCKAHSASFAVESFQSLYLKTYYPREFMVAVINNFGGFYSTEVYLHELRMCGGIIHAPCINYSHYMTSIDGDDVYVGFVHIKDLEAQLARRLVQERTIRGKYIDLEDFVRRLDVSKQQLEILIRIGAFRFTGLNKYELMWNKSAVFNPNMSRSATGYLFEEPAESYTIPTLEDDTWDQAFDEMELLGFPLCSPFDLLETPFIEDIMAHEMLSKKGKAVTMLGYYIARKYVTTSTKKLMYFGTWVDRQGHFFDSVHFPKSLEKYLFKGKGVYRIRGRIVEDFGFPSVDVEAFEKLPYIKDKRY